MSRRNKFIARNDSGLTVPDSDLFRLLDYKSQSLDFFFFFLNIHRNRRWIIPQTENYSEWYSTGHRDSAFKSFPPRSAQPKKPTDILFFFYLNLLPHGRAIVVG